MKKNQERKIILKIVSIVFRLDRMSTRGLASLAEFRVWVANLKATCIIWSSLRTMAAYFISQTSECPFYHFPYELLVLLRHVRTCNWLMTRAYIFYSGILINSEAHSRDFCAGRPAQCKRREIHFSDYKCAKMKQIKDNGPLEGRKCGVRVG